MNKKKEKNDQEVKKNRKMTISEEGRVKGRSPLEATKRIDYLKGKRPTRERDKEINPSQREKGFPRGEAKNRENICLKEKIRVRTNWKVKTPRKKPEGIEDSR